jgi:hypothetical protein
MVMDGSETIEHIRGSDAPPKAEGFRRTDSSEGTGAELAVGPDSGANPGAVLWPNTALMEAALYRDALVAATRLKEKFGALWAKDPPGFRAAVRKAHAAAFRRKPGPQPDPRIVEAAKERTHGAGWSDLYPRYIEHYVGMPEFTKDLAESGFRRKIYDHLQRHPWMSRKRTGGRKRKATTAPANRRK